MKLKHILLSAIAGATLILTGCKKDYLELNSSEFISYDQLIEASRKDPGLLAGTVNGLYATMYQVGSGGTTGHDDFGQKGYDIFLDMLSGDMALIGVTYGWYTPIVRFQASLDYTRNNNYMPWRFYYRLILGANTVLDALGGDSIPQTEPVRRHIAGQAKAMRAYSYFYLSQFYSKEYGDGSEKILPIYTNTKMVNQPKSTTKQVFDLMEKDLDTALVYLSDFNRATKDQVDATVAKGMLAYILAYRGTQADLQRVVTLTQDIVDTYPLTTPDETVARIVGGVLQNPQSGFNNVATPSWIWGVDLTLASNLDLVSWWGQVDYYTYSYAGAGDAKVMDRGLQSSIKTDDIRRGQFHSTGRPLQKFFDPKRVPMGQRSVTTDYIYMRTDEFLLLNAEAKARLGQDGPAKDMLKQLLDERIGDYSYVDALVGPALLDEVYKQTRVELWGEGKSYLAMKRLKKSITRGSNHLYFAGNTYAYNAPELSFPIPQAEVLNNPVLNK